MPPIVVPADIATWTAAQKIQWYRLRIAAGYSDAAIRAAVEAVVGKQTDEAWNYLKAQAATGGAGAGAAGGNAGTLILAAAAAYFLLG